MLALAGILGGVVLDRILPDDLARAWEITLAVAVLVLVAVGGTMALWPSRAKPKPPEEPLPRERAGIHVEGSNGIVSGNVVDGYENAIRVLGDGNRVEENLTVSRADPKASA